MVRMTGSFGFETSLADRYAKKPGFSEKPGF